jgi:hypothetical protein
MSVAQEPLPNVDSWEALQLRLIAFPQEIRTDFRVDWWHDLTGETECETTRKTLERTDTGIFEGRRLTMSLDGLKAIWSVDPVFNTDPSISELPQMPTLGPLTEAQAWFVRLMGRWLSNGCPTLKRVALCSRLAQWAPTKDDSYRLLSRYLPGISVDRNASDFLYRINRPTPSRSGIENLCINRLCTWMAAKFEIQLEARVASNPVVLTQLTMPEARFGCVFESDINTAAEFQGPLVNAQLPGLIREMAQMNAFIVQNGETRPWQQ